MRFLFIYIYLFICIGSVAAQISIGSDEKPKPYSLIEIDTNVKGGLRLPQLNNEQKESLKNLLDVESKGLLIFNIDTQCVEYWNGIRWINLCKGNANISFIGGNPNEPSFPWEGENRGPFIPEEQPPCLGKDPYSFLIISGNQYTNIELSNSHTGEFYISMSENNSARKRTAIVRITNNCTNEYKEFIFVQEGNPGLCNPIPAGKPTMSSADGNLSLCIGGAVYLYINNPTSGVKYIWTLNEIVVGTGIHYEAVVSGSYKVYANAVGCESLDARNMSDPVIITKSSDISPSVENMKIVATNNAVICNNNLVTLWAINVPVGSTIVWFKDGILQNTLTGMSSVVVTTEGEWVAALKEGNCYSSPSDKINITQISGSSNATPKILLNGTDYNSAVLCSGGSIELILSNYADFGAVTVKWFNGTTLLGEGQRIVTTAPSSGDFLLRCLITDNADVLCPMEVAVLKNLSAASPPRPNILTSSDFICGSNPVTLSSSVLANSYSWYSNSVLISGVVTQSATFSQTGAYQLQVTDAGGCKSPLSTPLFIGLSDFPQLSWIAKYDEVEPGTTKTFQVSGSFNPSDYKWTVDGGANVTNGNGTNIVTISFPNLPNGVLQSTVNVTVKATNSCGVGVPLTIPVLVKVKCDPFTVGNTTLSANNLVVAGTNISMSVGISSGTGPFTYQWKKNGTNVTGATNSTYVISGATTTHSGTYTCTITQTCSGANTTVTVGSFTVLDVAKMTAGSGTLTGPTCFDIAFSNDNSTCGILSTRLSMKADFSQTATNTQTYVFTPQGTGISNVRFLYINRNGEVIKSLTPDGNYSGSITTPCTATVIFNEQLNELAKGLTTELGLTAHIYVVYTSSGKDYVLKITVLVSDCNCCGAYIATGVWKSFMCHNLGADEGLNAMIPVVGIIGNFYQEGYNNVVATGLTPKGAIKGWVVRSSKWTGSNPSPCPTGTRLPTQAELLGVYNNNARTIVGSWNGSYIDNNIKGIQFGTKLVIPLASYRIPADGSLATNFYSTTGALWCSNGSFVFSNTQTPNTSGFQSGVAFNIRCISE